MKTSLLLARKRKKPLTEYGKAMVDRVSRVSRGDHAQPKDADTPLAGVSSVVGYWMIPKGGGEYVKLKVFGEYKFKEDLMMPKLSTIIASLGDSKQSWAGRISGAMGGVIGKTEYVVDIVLGGNLLPVWPIVCNVQALCPHFPWLKTLVASHSAVFSPSKADECAAAAVAIQSTLISKGWGFCIKQGSEAYFCGTDDKLFERWMKELGGDLAVPTNLTIGDVKTIKKVRWFTPSGGKASEMAMEDILKRLKGLPKKPDRTSTFAEYINYQYSRGGVGHNDFLPTSKPRPWRDHEDWLDIDQQIMRRHFSKRMIEAIARRYHGNPSALSALKGALWTAFEYAKAKKIDLSAWGWSDQSVDDDVEDMLAESLTEATFRQLLQATARNGGYRYGGLRRIGRLWVYDPAVRDRVANSRFVITRRPALQLDSDGFPEYRFTFRSRADRSTTGMSHTGYIKFTEEQNNTGWMARLKGYFKDEIDLQVHVGCTCFAAGTGVLMADGTHKDVSKVQVGDMVITHLGRARRVTAARSRSVRDDENVYRMKVQGNPHEMIVTGEHPFYTLRGNSECLCGCGARLVRPKRSAWSPEVMLNRRFIRGHGSKKAVLDDKTHGTFDWVAVDAMHPNEWFLSPWLEGGVVSMDHRLAALTGYYAAEGSSDARGTRVRLTLNVSEWDTLGADALSLCAELGLRARRVRAYDDAGNERSWFNVVISDSDFKAHCIRHVGTGSHHKRLSETLMSLDDASSMALISRMFLGDGTVGGVEGGSRTGRVRYFSVSGSLAAQAQALLSKLKLRSSLSFHCKTEKITNHFSKREKRVVSLKRSRCYQVCLDGEASEMLRVIMRSVTAGKDNMPPCPPRKRAVKYVPKAGQLRAMLVRELVQFDGEVYDLTVEEDESFVANGVAVHNCPDFKYRWHKVLADNGASHTPTGAGFDATDQRPTITNPRGMVSLCKHLVALKDFMLMDASEHYAAVAKLRKGSKFTAGKIDDPKTKKVKPGASLI